MNYSTSFIDTIHQVGVYTGGILNSTAPDRSRRRSDRMKNGAMSQTFDTSVLIVGAGPVGLTLAMDLSFEVLRFRLMVKRGRNSIALFAKHSTNYSLPGRTMPITAGFGNFAGTALIQ